METLGAHSAPDRRASTGPHRIRLPGCRECSDMPAQWSQRRDVRGGLQAMPRGQYEAAESIGLNYFLTMRLIILPQALKIVIPPTVSILISAFKDTSLVVIIALWDLLKTTQATLSNPEWMGFSREAYIFVAILYFLGCFSMANYSRKLEKELSTEDH